MCPFAYGMTFFRIFYIECVFWYVSDQMKVYLDSKHKFNLYHKLEINQYYSIIKQQTNKYQFIQNLLNSLYNLIILNIVTSKSMPPKKKEQQIDISTLPPCHSINSFLFCKGNKTRADAILTQIKKQTIKYLSILNKQEVLDHAKEKAIYIDPNTLTDKQKKDPKFMETVSTQLTPEIIAKSVASYINQANIKVRMEKKLILDKPQGERPPTERNFDWMYVFQDFPESKEQFVELAKIEQNLRYIFVIDPKISWANAPQIPEPIPQQQDGQPEPEDEEIVQFKKLKQKEQFKETDHNHILKIQSTLDKIRLARSQSPISSQFRNTVIIPVECEIDPYHENESINLCVHKFIQASNKVLVEYGQFMNWKSQRKTQSILNQKEEAQKNISKLKVKGDKIEQMLLNMCLVLDDDQRVDIKKNQNQYEQQLINLLQKGQKQVQVSQFYPQNIPSNRRSKINQIFVNENELFNRDLMSQQIINLISRLKYPGVNRNQMPEQPTKSLQLRNLYRSHYGLFLPPGLTLDQFQRRMSLIKFQNILKETEQERSYKFGDRKYQQIHDQESLVRTLYKNMLLDQFNIHSKYHVQSDSLYLAMVYKNPIRRLYNKKWDSNWRVLPNYENWLHHFKENQSNITNYNFYDIDYQKIGHIEEKNKVITTKDGGVIIHKTDIVANSKITTLYVLKHNSLIGVKEGQTYIQNNGIKIFHLLKDKEAQIIIMFGQNKKIILNQKGDIISYVKGQKTRLNTPSGYTVIYGEGNNDRNLILHPNGGISYPPSGFTNTQGNGIVNGEMQSIPCLKRTNTDQSIITKRDDGTVIINKENTTWIKFKDQTEYLRNNTEKGETIKITKAQFPLISCQNEYITAQLNGIKIQGIPVGEGKFIYRINLIDHSYVKVQGLSIILEENQKPIYTFDVQNNTIRAENGGEELHIDLNGKSTLKRSSKIVDPEEDQEKYTPQDVLPQDYIQPKLFIIRNDNTAIQLISQKELSKYFQEKEDQKYVKRIVSEVDGKQVLQYVHGLQNLNEMNDHKIRENFKVNLDIFTYSKPSMYVANERLTTIRSFICNKQLSEQERKQLQQICDKCQQWRKQNIKQQNEYGFCQQNKEVLQGKYEMKKQTIKYRKEKQIHVQHQLLKNKAISQAIALQKKHQTIIQMKEDELKLRKSMSFRKPYESKYKPIEIIAKPIQEDLEQYSNLQFFPHYFVTVQGQKALLQIPQSSLKPKQKKQKKQLDPQIVNELNATMNKTQKQQQQVHNNEDGERYDTVQLELSPNKQIIIKPSVFTRKEIDEEREAFEKEKKSYDYHEKKRKDFNVYGQERKGKIQVPSLLRTQPISQINQKYLVTQAPVDHKVKISSMKNKLSSGASNMYEMRKEGPHSALIKTLDMGNDYNKLLERRTMMVHADLNDKLQRDILINPTQANFGVVRQNHIYEIKIQIKNQDILAQRIILKKPKTICARVQMNQMGSIALGMTRKISVFLQTSSDISGKFTDEFDIVTKHQIYHIPRAIQILNRAY